jgi:cold shock protein
MSLDSRGQLSDSSSTQKVGGFGRPFLVGCVIVAPLLGTVKWFNQVKGYGLIQPQNGGRDIFVHISAVERAGLSTLNEGQSVEYEEVSNELAILHYGPSPRSLYELSSRTVQDGHIWQSSCALRKTHA